METTVISFDEIRAANNRRLLDFPGHEEDWTVAEWGCALAGETGELCNLLKKVRRGEEVDIVKIENEIADVFLYLDLTAAQFGIDLLPVIVRKFNEVSDRYGFDQHKL